MRSLFWAIFALFSLSAFCGCGTHREVDARFDVFNTTSESAVFVVNANIERPMSPNSSQQFIISIPVPYAPQHHRSFGTGPSVYDEWVNANVSFRVGGDLLPPVPCSAGAKVAASVTLRRFNGRLYVECQSARGEKQEEGSGSS